MEILPNFANALSRGRAATTGDLRAYLDHLNTIYVEQKGVIDTEIKKLKNPTIPSNKLEQIQNWIFQMRLKAGDHHMHILLSSMIDYHIKHDGPVTVKMSDDFNQIIWLLRSYKIPKITIDEKSSYSVEKFIELYSKLIDFSNRFAVTVRKTDNKTNISQKINHAILFEDLNSVLLEPLFGVKKSVTLLGIAKIKEFCLWCDMVTRLYTPLDVTQSKST